MGFSVVALGYTLLSPRLHIVSAAHYQNVRLAMQRLKARGAKRIGLAMKHFTDVRCQSMAFAAHAAKQTTALGWTTDQPLIPPLFDYNSAAGVTETICGLCRYVRAHRLQALLLADIPTPNFSDLLRSKLPAGVEIVDISMRERKNLAGIYEDSEAIGSVAMDFLVGMLQRGERGIPMIPVHTLVEGKWWEPSALNSPSKNPRGARTFA